MLFTLSHTAQNRLLDVSCVRHFHLRVLVVRYIMNYVVGVPLDEPLINFEGLISALKHYLP